MIRAILFDFGNVVAFFDHRRATRRFAESSAMAEAEMYTAIYDGPLEHDFESGRIGGDEFLDRVTKLIGYTGERDPLGAAFVDIFTPNSAVIDLIPRLKPRYRLILASNTNPLHFGHYRELFGDTLRHFDALGVSFEAGVRKPARGFFEHCVRLAGCPARECLFIDDMSVNVTGAQSAGLNALIYRPEVNLEHALRRFDIQLKS